MRLRVSGLGIGIGLILDLALGFGLAYYKFFLLLGSDFVIGIASSRIASIRKISFGIATQNLLGYSFLNLLFNQSVLPELSPQHANFATVNVQELLSRFLQAVF